MIPHADAADLRRDLGCAIEALQVEPGGALRGRARFGPALVGPPGRLHGGLHAYARLIPVWRQAIGPLPPYLRLTLDLLRPLRLEQPCAFTGRAAPDRLQTRFGDRGLDGTASAAGPAPAELLERFGRLREHDPLEHELMAARTVPVRIGRALASMQATSAAAIDTGNTVARFMPSRGPADAVWVCGTLDLLAAVVQGFGWRSHVFTVRMDLTLCTEPVQGPVLLLGDRATRPDAAVPLPPLEGRRAMAVPVLLADPGLTRVHAWGEISLYPARRQLVK